MPKRSRSADEIQREFEAKIQRPASRRQDEPARAIELDRLEKISAVCELFCQGLRVREIQAAMREKYGEAGEMKREEPYTILNYAATKGWLQFRPAPHLVFAHQIRTGYPWLANVDVVHSTVVADVAQRAAEVVVKLVQSYGHEPRPRSAVHIGLAGGLTMRQFAKALADELCLPTENLPETICFHALVAGSDQDDPTTVPNAFFTYFLDRPIIQVRPRFIGFNARAMIKTAELPELMEQPDIRDAHAEIDKIDIIVVTGADCPRHSTLYRRMQRSPATLQAVQDADWSGDVLWRPMGKYGPITTQTEIRAMTLVEPAQLPDFLARKKHVLLLLGPCSDCHKPKDGILAALLNQDEHYLNHLVIDSRTAARFIDHGMA
ncbi:MAG: hypothetical protein ABIF77_06845 [bacterium]